MKFFFFIFILKTLNKTIFGLSFGKARSAHCIFSLLTVHRLKSQFSLPFCHFTMTNQTSDNTDKTPGSVDVETTTSTTTTTGPSIELESPSCTTNSGNSSEADDAVIDMETTRITTPATKLSTAVERTSSTTSSENNSEADSSVVDVETTTITTPATKLSTEFEPTSSTSSETKCAAGNSKVDVSVSVTAIADDSNSVDKNINSDNASSKNESQSNRNSQIDETDALFKMPEAFVDPVFPSFDVFQNPVTTPYGQTFERESIEYWIKTHGTCPVSGLPLQISELVPNRQLQDAITEFFEKRSELEGALQRLRAERNRLRQAIDDMDTSERLKLSQFRDPIHFHVMRRPVKAADGHIYDESSIRLWFLNQEKIGDSTVILSPVTREPLTNLDLEPMEDVKTEIESWLKRRQEASKAGTGTATADNITGIEELSTIFKILDDVRDDLEQMLDGWQPPRIVVIGQQNHGKSTQLNRMCLNKLFPQAASICTRVPIKIDIRHTALPLPAKVELWDTDNNKAIGEPRFIPFDEAYKDIEEVMLQAVEGQPNKIATNRELRVTIMSPSLPPMSLLDLPGLVEFPPELRKATYSLVEKYLDQHQDSSIVLLVNKADDNPNNSAALGIVKAKGLQARTVGVLTFCDRLEGFPSEEHTELRKMLANPEELQPHGFVAVSNRKCSVDGESNHYRLKMQGKKELDWIETNKLQQQLADKTVGSGSVVDKVGKMYSDYTQETFVPDTIALIVNKHQENHYEQVMIGLPASPGNLGVSECAELRAAAIHCAEKSVAKITTQHMAIFENEILPGFQAQIQALLKTITLPVGKLKAALIEMSNDLLKVLEQTVTDINDRWDKLCNKICRADPLPFRPQRFPKFVNTFRTLCGSVLRQQITQEQTDKIGELFREALSECKLGYLQLNFDMDAEQKMVTASVEGFVQKAMGALVMGMQTPSKASVRTAIQSMVEELFAFEKQLQETVHLKRQKYQRKQLRYENAATRVLDILLEIAKPDLDGDWKALDFLARVKAVVPSLPDALLFAHPAQCILSNDGSTIISATADGTRLETGGLPLEAVCRNHKNRVIEHNGSISFTDHGDGTYTVTGEPPWTTETVSVLLFGVEIENSPTCRDSWSFTNRANQGRTIFFSTLDRTSSPAHTSNDNVVFNPGNHVSLQPVQRRGKNRRRSRKGRGRGRVSRNRFATESGRGTTGLFVASDSPAKVE